MDKKQKARNLYLVSGKTQREIALEVGVSEKTIYNWIHTFAWNKLKQATLQAPATIVDNLYSQLVEMQNAIAAREPCKRFPTQQEADITRKLILSIQSMKSTMSLSQNVQMMESFRDFVRPLNTQFTKQLAHYANKFLETKSKTGYAPYQMEYGIDAQAALAPFYEELEGDQPCDLNNPPDYSVPCTDVAACPKETGCIFPFCKASAPIRDDPKELAKNDIPWQPLPAKLPPFPVEQEEIENRKNNAELVENKCIELFPVQSPNRKGPEKTGKDTQVAPLQLPLPHSGYTSQPGQSTSQENAEAK